MSVDARLPASYLDIPRLESCCRSVAAALHLDCDFRADDIYSVCYFTVPAARARFWELAAGGAGYDGDGEVAIEIAFTIVEAHATVSFDGHRHCPRLGHEIFSAVAKALAAE